MATAITDSFIKMVESQKYKRYEWRISNANGKSLSQEELLTCKKDLNNRLTGLGYQYEATRHAGAILISAWRS